MTEWIDGLREVQQLHSYYMKTIEKFSLSCNETICLNAAGSIGLLVIAEGQCKTVGGNLLITKGDSMFVSSSIELQKESDAHVVHGCFIVFSPAQLPVDAGSSLSIPRQWNEIVIRFKPFAQQLEELLTLYKQAETAAAMLEQFKLQLHFQALLCKLLEYNSIHESHPDSTSAVRQSIAFLHEHYAEEHTVAQLAGRINLSARQYTRLFKKITGKSPIDYLNDYRIKRSKELLLQTNEPTRQISSKIGMKDVTYFNRRFKHIVGCSPREYVRKRHLDSKIVTMHYAGEMLALGMKPLGSLEVTLNQLQDTALISSIGYDTCQLDKLEALQPDLIIASDFMSRKELLELENFAPVVVIPWDVQSFDRLQRVARLLGKEKQAENWHKRYMSKKIEAQQRCRAKLKKGETAAILGVKDGTVWVYASRFFPTFYEVIGFQPSHFMNKTTEAYSEQRRVAVSLEDIEQLEADRLYIVEEMDPDFEQGLEQLQQAAGWNSLTAVQKNRVYVIPHCGISNSAYTLEWQLDMVDHLIDPPQSSHIAYGRAVIKANDGAGGGRETE